MKADYRKLTPQQVTRFWSYVERGSGCWEWQKSCGSHGYGQFGISGGPEQHCIMFLEEAH